MTRTSKPWGEHRFSANGPEVAFLRALGMVRPDVDALTDLGQAYFVAAHIRGEADESATFVRKALCDLPPAAAILQLLAGLGRIPRVRAETVLRSQKLTDGLTDRSLGTLLALLNRFEIVRYSKGDGSFEVLIKPQVAAQPPRSIFIAPDTAYGNRVWLRRVLEECDDHIYWLDKHFKPIAFEPLWEAADRSRIRDVKVLSLRLADNSGRQPLRDYSDLKKELAGRGIRLEWRYIEPASIRDTHDRWIIGKSVARNIPDVGSVFSGHHSELNISDQAPKLRELFLDYWIEATRVDSSASKSHSRTDRAGHTT